MRRSPSLSVLEYASLGLPSLGPLATPVKHPLSRALPARCPGYCFTAAELTSTSSSWIFRTSFAGSGTTPSASSA